MKAEQSSFYEWQKTFSNDAKCMRRLKQIRWPNGFQCPHCGHNHGYWSESLSRYECSACYRQSSVISGTLFHATKLPLTKWFWAIYWVGTDKGGISALRLSKLIGVAWRSAYRMLKKLRIAMGHRDSIYRLSDIVELDDALVGGKKPGKRWEDDDRFAQVAKVSGFSLHAGVAAQAWERQKLERLCRYISRPAVTEKRLSLTPSGNVRYQLKTPYSDGTTHVIFEPLDFIAKLAALVPKPRVNLTRFHGVFAPNSKHRVDVTPAKRGKGRPHEEHEDKTPEQRHQSMTWAQRLKRVFNIDVSVCPKCGGEARVIASIEDQQIIDKILAHLMKKGALPPPPVLLPATRATPDSGWFT